MRFYCGGANLGSRTGKCCAFSQGAYKELHKKPKGVIKRAFVVSDTTAVVMHMLTTLVEKGLKPNVLP